MESGPQQNRKELPAESQSIRSFPWLFGAILGLGVLFKALYLWSYASNSPFYYYPRLDSAVYIEWAKSIQTGGWLGKEVFHQAPLYPYLLSILFQLFGDRTLWVYLVQLLMGVGTLALITLTGKRVFNDRAALIAAFLCLTYAPFTSYETKILTTAPEMLLGMISLYLLVRAEQEQHRGLWVAGGFFLGLSIICRPNYIMVVPLMLAALLVRYRRELKAVWVPVAAIALMPSLVIGAVTVRNAVVGGDFVLISSSGGATFAQGNNPAARGAMTVLPGFSSSAERQRHEEAQIAERRLGRRLKPSEVSAYWFGRGMAFIKERPAAFAKLLLNKTLLVFSSHELGNNYLMSIDTRLTPCLKLAFMPFGLIMAFSAAGLVAVMRTRAAPLIVVSTFLGTLSMLLLFYVCTRFRMTLAPVAVICAGGGVDTLLSHWREPRRIALPLVSGAVAFALSLPLWMPLGPTQLQRGDADYWTNLAVAYELNGEPEKALHTYETAIGMKPDKFGNYQKKTELMKARGDNGLLEWVRYTARCFPAEYAAQLELADATSALGRVEEGAEAYRRAISLSPRRPEAYVKLGALWGRMGLHGRARGVLAEGLGKNPDDTGLQYNYAIACFAMGDRQAAIEALRRVMAKDPDFGKSRSLAQELQMRD